MEPIAVAVAIVVYFARVFGLTAFYHRYFSHRAFRTSRIVQFAGALLGNAAGQRGPIWWAAHHRHHHRASDKPNDIHSPVQQGFLWSHMLWFTTSEAYETDHRMVKDWLKFPELRFLERFDFFAPALLAAFMFPAWRMPPDYVAESWNEWVSITALGIYHLDRRSLSRHVCDQLARSHIWNTSVCDG